MTIDHAHQQRSTIVKDEWIHRKARRNTLEVYLRIGDEAFKEVCNTAQPQQGRMGNVIDITSDGDATDKFFGAANISKLRASLDKKAKFMSYALFVVPRFTDIP